MPIFSFQEPFITCRIAFSAFTTFTFTPVQESLPFRPSSGLVHPQSAVCAPPPHFELYSYYPTDALHSSSKMPPTLRLSGRLLSSRLTSISPRIFPSTVRSTPQFRSYAQESSGSSSNKEHDPANSDKPSKATHDREHPDPPTS
jgi:hypothetical protein